MKSEWRTSHFTKMHGAQVDGGAEIGGSLEMADQIKFFFSRLHTSFAGLRLGESLKNSEKTRTCPTLSAFNVRKRSRR